jgi:restriction system protein
MGRRRNTTGFFARGKPIELIGGTELLELIQASRETDASPPATYPRVEHVVPPPSAAPAQAATCPLCGSPLVERTNRRTGELFLGCSQFPRCRGTSR